MRGILWKEIGVAHGGARVPLGGKLLTQQLEIRKDWFALGFTAPDWDPDRFQGWHAEYILVILDEASGMSQRIFDEGVEALMASGDARLLLIGNPTNPVSEFAKSFKDSSYKKFKISAFDTPNFTHFGITQSDIVDGSWESKITGPLPMPWLISPVWVAERYRKWRLSPMYQARILADFPEDGENIVVPLHLVEAAQDRTLPEGTRKVLSVDVARFGSDESVVMRRLGPVIRQILSRHGVDTMGLVGEIVRLIRAEHPDYAAIDSIGIGAGVFDRLKELEGEGKLQWQVREANGRKHMENCRLVEAIASGGAFDKEQFVNARAEWFWNIRELCESGDIDLEQDDELAAQLSSMKYKINSRGQIVIESKEEMKKRGLPSPDKADGVAIAFANLATTGAAGFSLPGSRKPREFG